jgi:hypothetical protein
VPSLINTTRLEGPQDPHEISNPCLTLYHVCIPLTRFSASPCKTNGRSSCLRTLYLTLLSPLTTSPCLPHFPKNTLLMSSRVTRSSARQAASQAGHLRSPAAVDAAPADPASLSTSVPSTAAATPGGLQLSRKRKASLQDLSPVQPSPEPLTSTRRSKRQKVPENKRPLPPPAQSLAKEPLAASSRRKQGKVPATMSSPE